MIAAAYFLHQLQSSLLEGYERGMATMMDTWIHAMPGSTWRDSVCFALSCMLGIFTLSHVIIVRRPCGRGYDSYGAPATVTEHTIERGDVE